MTSRKIIPSNYLDIKGFLETKDIKISDVINEMVSNGKEYENWFKNLLHEDMTEVLFSEHYPNILSTTANRYDYKRQCGKELGKYGIARSPFEFKQDVEVSTLFEDWIVLKLKNCGIDNLGSNDKATNSAESRNANSHEDYIYVSDSGESIPLELKTRYIRYANDFSVQFREGADRLKNNKSLVFVYYPYKSKAAIVDFADENVVKNIKPNIAYGKEGEKFDINPNDLFSFDICSSNMSFLKRKIEDTLKHRK